MIKTFIFLTVIVLAYACQNKTINPEKEKEKFGNFGSKAMKLLPLDYTRAPIYNKIKHHPENYAYLEKVNIYEMGYMSDGHFVKGFLVAPKDKGKYPCVIYNRGGNRDFGCLLVATAVEQMAKLAANGYVVAASNYRGNCGGEGKEEFGGSDIKDVLNLTNSLHEFDAADTSKIGLLGISRGGMMNYLSLKNHTSNNIKTAVAIGGITNLETTIKYHPEIETVAEELIPNFKNHRTVAVKSRSVVFWTDSLPLSSPLLILHGMQDDHVHYSQAEELTEKLDKNNIPYQFISFKNDNHGILNHQKEVEEKILHWFDKYLKNELPFSEQTKRIIIE